MAFRSPRALSLLAVSVALAFGSTAFGQAPGFVYGVDVSNHQGAINWTSVKAAGILFAFAKATEGVDFVDARFLANIAAAPSAKVYFGPYHFARVDSNSSNPNDAIDEANDFVDAIEPYYNNPAYLLRPVLDVERVIATGTTAQKRAYGSEWVRDFIGVVQSRLGTTPIIYCNTDYATNYFEADIAQYPLWLASLTATPPNLPPASADGIWNGWDFWQYSWTGSVAGISGNVDRDVYQGSLDQMLQEFGIPFGDYDGDKDKDGADLLAWQRGFGTAAGATRGMGDGDFDLDVDGNDLALWKAKFGLPVPPSTIPVGAAPEPTSGLMLAVLSAAAFACRRNSAFFSDDQRLV